MSLKYNFNTLKTDTQFKGDPLRLLTIAGSTNVHNNEEMMKNVFSTFWNAVDDESWEEEYWDDDIDENIDEEEEPEELDDPEYDEDDDLLEDDLDEEDDWDDEDEDDWDEEEESLSD